jgi:glycosyltransferase involved in cell wall biosynthesis
MVSVIIPAYNAEKSIIKTLNSVIDQSYKGKIEIIVVDDGSKDRTRELVENYEAKGSNKSLKIISQPNGGVSKARNTGIKNASGIYLAFLDSDDTWFEDKIETQVQYFETNKSIDFLAGGFDILYLKNKKENELIKIGVNDLIYKNFFQPSTVMMKREIVKTIGLFDENQKYAEEGNYFIRICNEYNCYFLNKKLINYGDGKSGFGDSGLSSNLIEMQKGFEKNLKYAYNHKLISSGQYLSAVIFSKLKYLRRVLIVKFRK